MLWWIVRGGGGPNEGHGGRSSCAFGVSATDIDLSHVKIVIPWHRAGCNWDALIPKRFFESTAVLQSCRFLIDGTIAILSFWVTHLAVPVAIFLVACSFRRRLYASARGRFRHRLRVAPGT